ncbi:hypothetical protein Mlute_02728 [Meiothermus luteus]|jgi:uncharacterized protein with HEPN domain|uniref:DUF86 domain-containing protein n=1 Tax=Meiothermus luteus TaxID=2026184 RepID=A0A399ED00_9DEIN|nr:DUF86 domain-containing protein [Meiothermus luteus]RIH81686.1 hypothetical protein Mlute_02728 [Meiothermus luteus]
MSERTDREFLSDIQEAIRRIHAYTAGMTYEAFLTDTKTQDAVIRNLEIMGEATKNLSEGIRAKYGGVPWKSMAGVRDRLIHHYFGTNLEIVWQIAAVELTSVASQLEQILRSEFS